jgi:hypothetical protein
VTGLPSGFAEDLTDLVQRAVRHRIVLQLALWSFDMCKVVVGIIMLLVVVAVVFRNSVSMLCDEF